MGDYTERRPSSVALGLATTGVGSTSFGQTPGVRPLARPKPAEASRIMRA